jgi:hypothetical protein
MLLPPQLVQIFSPASNHRASLSIGDHVHTHQRKIEIGFADTVLSGKLFFMILPFGGYLLVQQSLAKRQDQLRFLKNTAYEKTKV